MRIEAESFEINGAMAALLTHSRSEYVLLMDNDCYPAEIDLGRRDARLMFPTVHRFFMTNILVPRSVLAEFVNRLPNRLLFDSTSFEGMDQVWAWYFGVSIAPLKQVKVRTASMRFLLVDADWHARGRGDDRENSTLAIPMTVRCFRRCTTIRTKAIMCTRGAFSCG